jgi:hypothetical protein
MLGLGLLVASLPSQLSISNWQPGELFQANLLIQLDELNWPILLATASLPLSLFLCSPARPDSSNPVTRSLVLAYSGLSMMAMLAANSATVIMTWVSTDIFGFLLLLTAAEEFDTIQGGFRRFVAHLGSSILVLAGTLPLGFAEDTFQIRQGLWLLAVILRIGLIPLHVPMPTVPGIRRGLGVALRLLPPAMGLAFLVRFSAGRVPPGLGGIFLLLAGLSVLIGGIRWSAASDLIRERPFFVLTVAGMAIAAASGQNFGLNALIGLTVLIILLGTATSQLVLYEPWHRYVLLALVALALGAPWTIGHLMFTGGPDPTQLSPAGIGIRSVLIVGSVLVALGIARPLDRGPQDWVRGESFVKNAYALGLAIPILAAVLAGLQRGAKPNPVSITFFGVALLLAAAAWLTRDRWLAATQPLAQWVTGGGVGRGNFRFVDIGLASLRAGSALFRGLGRFFEGRAALLWVYVVLLVAALFLVGAGGGG